MGALPDSEVDMTATTLVTLLAALIAALASVANVLLTRRGASENEREKWRRQEAGAIAARIATTTRALRAEWATITDNLDTEMRASGEYLENAREAARTGRERALDLDRAVQMAIAELELLTESQAVIDATRALLDGFEYIWHTIRPGGGDETKWQSFQDRAPEVIDSNLDALVIAVREDLGIKRLK